MVVDIPRRVVHGGTGKLVKEKNTGNVLDFSASVNPFPPRVDWHCDPASLEYYPDDSYSLLKERIATVFHRKPEEVCVGNGSIEIIRAFCAVVLGHAGTPRTFYLEPPTFGEYEFSARLAGAEPVTTPAGADVWFVCNPNNPTGQLLAKSEILAKREKLLPQNGILFCDEAFIGLADPRESISGVVDPGLFVLHSLTKTFAVPGLRFGFGLGDPVLVEQVETVRCPWSVNAYAEAFALCALTRLDDLAVSRRKIAGERRTVMAELEGMGLSCRPSATNFILVTGNGPAGPLVAALAQKGILVRDCTSFGLPASFRIAIRTPDENRQLLEALAACVH